MKSFTRIGAGLATLVALTAGCPALAQAVPAGNLAYETTAGVEMTTLTPTATLGGKGTTDDSSPALSPVGQIAYQDATNDLTTDGPYGKETWTLAMAPNSSPSIVSSPASPGGMPSWIVAFNGHGSHDLWTAGTNGGKNWGMQMAVGSSPSIAGSSTAYKIALDTWKGYLAVVDQTGATQSTTDAIEAGSSPSIANTGSDGWVVAYKNAGGYLAIVQGDSAGVTGPKVTSYIPAAGTNPSVSSPGDGTYVIAWQGSGGGHLNTLDSKGYLLNTPEVMATNSTPSIETGFAGGAYKIAYQAADGDLSQLTATPGPACPMGDPTGKCTPSSPTTSNVDELKSVMAGTSPSIS